MPFSKPPGRLRGWIVALLVLGLHLPTHLVLAKDSGPDQDQDLVPDGVAIERRLQAGEQHAYGADLDLGRRYLVELEQLGIDVQVEATAVNGEGLVVDAPTYRQGWETLLLPEGVAGDWRIVVRSASPAVGPGSYRLWLRELSETSSRRLQAWAAVSQAGRLSFAGTAEDRRRAVDWLGQARILWQALGDRSGEARALVAVGALQVALGDYRPAIEAYGAALPMLRQAGDRDLEAVALNDLGLAHWRLGEGDQAQALLDQALVLQKSLGNRYGASIALNNLCLRAHSSGQLRAALGCYQEVLQLLREQGELQYESLVLGNLGSAYNNLGEPQLALEHHQRALAIRQATSDRVGEAQSLNNLAVVYRRGGEMQAALEHYQQALGVWRELGDAGRQGPVLSNIGYAYFSLGEPQRAQSFLQQSLVLRRQVGDRRGESITLNVLGQVHASRGEHDQARELFRQSLVLRREVGDLRGASSTLNRLGQSLVEGGQPASALEVFDEALSLLGEVEDRRESAIALHFRGAAQLLLNEPEKARFSLARALAVRVAIGDPHGEIETLTALAEAKLRHGQLEAAQLDVARATTKIETLRSRVGAPDLRATFLATQRRAYELQIDLLMAQHAAEPEGGYAQQARLVSERARARSLLDVLSAAGADLDSAVNPELSRRRAELQRRLDAKSSRRSALLSRGRAAEEAELELYEVIAELDTLEGEIRRQSPSYEALAQPRPLDLAATQELLGKDTLLLEYALGTQRSFLWAMTNEAFEAHELPGRAEIESAVRQVVQQLGTVDPRAASTERRSFSDLSKLLLGPVAELLEGRRLVVVADGGLHYLPFGTLPLPRLPEAVDRSPQSPLLVRHEVVHLPSVSALGVQRAVTADRGAASRWVAVLADPVFSAADARLTQGPSVAEMSTRSTNSDLTFDRLSLTSREAAAVAALAEPGQVMTALGFDADRELVLGGDLQGYRIIHFATHGLIQSEAPQLSGLVLSQLDRQGRAREGFLRLRDIYGLQLDAELVVLSGCQTALGREIAGEGLVGLTRGFMYAGVPRVVASLWRVEDRATAELMAAFYRAMSVDGQAPAAALRAAQLSIMSEKRWADPYYWGAFVLQGDWR